MMKESISFEQANNLGEELRRVYLAYVKKPDNLCFDIEGFVTDFLKLSLEYVYFATGAGYGVLADGESSELVYVNDEPQYVCFPKNTIVINGCLQEPNYNGRRRLTIAYEAAHYLLNKMYPEHRPIYFVNFDEMPDTPETPPIGIIGPRDPIEARADIIATALLMPHDAVAQALRLYNNEKPIKLFGENVNLEEELKIARTIANVMGVTAKELLLRMNELGLLERHYRRSVVWALTIREHLYE